MIENAARHSPDLAEIVIRLDTVSEAPEMLRAQVIDHGVGIPEEVRERIFTSFYSLRSPSYGNGMGLAICRGIVEAHQGRIWVEAAADAGSCFAFTLPTHPHTIVHTDMETRATTNKDCFVQYPESGSLKEDQPWQQPPSSNREDAPDGFREYISDIYGKQEDQGNSFRVIGEPA